MRSTCLALLLLILPTLPAVAAGLQKGARVQVVKPLCRLRESAADDARILQVAFQGATLTVQEQGTGKEARWALCSWGPGRAWARVDELSAKVDPTLKDGFVATTDLGWFSKRFPYSTWDPTQRSVNFDSDEYRALLAAAMVQSSDDIQSRDAVGHGLGIYLQHRSQGAKGLPPEVGAQLKQREVWRELLKRGYPAAIEHLPRRLRGDRSLMLELVARDKNAFLFAAEELRADPAFQREALHARPDLYSELSAEQHDDLGLLLAALPACPECLKYASPRLQGLPAVADAVVACCAASIPFIKVQTTPTPYPTPPPRPTAAPTPAKP